VEGKKRGPKKNKAIRKSKMGKGTKAHDAKNGKVGDPFGGVPNTSSLPVSPAPPVQKGRRRAHPTRVLPNVKRCYPQYHKKKGFASGPALKIGGTRNLNYCPKG